MKPCPGCNSSVSPEVSTCPFCAFSFVTGQKPFAPRNLGPNAELCVACSSPVTKGMRCIRCGVVSKKSGISKSTIFGVILAIVLVVVGTIVWDYIH
jgi:hypothetical protein